MKNPNDLLIDKKTVISLGWDCCPAIHSVNNCLRPTKSNGYKTCPFDQMINNYKGLIECINDDFKYFCDPSYLKVVTILDKYDYLNFPLNSNILVNTKYNFIMNHESSGHGNLWQNENWSKGQFHYEMDNFNEFIKRYERRIENFKYYINNGYEITFIISKVNNTIESNIDLETIIKTKYPNLKYKFDLIEETRQEIFGESIFFANNIYKYV